MEEEEEEEEEKRSGRGAYMHACMHATFSPSNGSTCGWKAAPWPCRLPCGRGSMSFKCRVHCLKGVVYEASGPVEHLIWVCPPWQVSGGAGCLPLAARSLHMGLRS
jgi:hypothetical protein